MALLHPNTLGTGRVAVVAATVSCKHASVEVAAATLDSSHAGEKQAGVNDSYCVVLWDSAMGGQGSGCTCG